MIGGTQIRPWRQCNAVTPAVTAAQTGSGTHNGMALTVAVVNNASISVYGPQYQSSFTPGTTASQSAASPAEVTLTPEYTGSWLYGAVNRNDASTAWTPATGTSFTQNVSDTTNTAAYGTFEASSSTTAGVPVTIGASNGGTSGGVAVAEIPAATTLAEDPSAPAPVSTTTATSVTTAHFTPPMGSLLVAMVSAAGSTSGTDLFTDAFTDLYGQPAAAVAVNVTDDNGMLAWTEQARWATAGSGYAGVWTAVVVCG